MVVKVQDVMELSELSEGKIVAGHSGLGKAVFWVHVVDSYDVLEWVQGGELLFTTGIGIRDNLEYFPEFVRECSEKGVAGLIVNIGPYIQEIPKAAFAVADELGFPLFEVPWAVKLVKVTRAIYTYIAKKNIEEKSIQDIFENVLEGSTYNYDNLLARAASCGYDLTEPHQIMVVRFEQLAAYFQKTGTLSEQQMLVVKLEILSAITGVFTHLGKKVLTLIRLDAVIIMLPSQRNYKEQQKTKEIASELLRVLPTRFVGLSFNVGWGNPHKDITEAKKSLAQAEQSIRVVQTIPDSAKCMGYDELGFFKVLFSVDRENLEEFRNEVLNGLLEYDRKHSAELANTLATYLEENGNCARVSERLYIHRNTLKYRVQKITDISGRNLSDPNDRMLLYFATIVQKFLCM